MVHDFSPLVEELSAFPDPAVLFQRLNGLPHVLFLDSAMRHSSLGRYSFIVADPFAFLRFSAEDPNSLNKLAQLLRQFPSSTLSGLPPFQGGAAGLFSYDLNRSLERITAPRFDEFAIPAMAIGLYDVVVAFDHLDERAWIISHGWPEVSPARRTTRAKQRLNLFREAVKGDRESERTVNVKADEVPTAKLAPQFQVAQCPLLTSNFAADDYRAAVRRVVEYIHAGDAFQVNLSQRLLYPANDPSTDLYLRLRERNPATFSAYFDLGEFQIVSASPERFLSLRDGWVETRPIKGTRQRMMRPEADLMAADDLLHSEKDRAENVMIVDLLRNDISRVCEPETVQVTQLCELEVYQFVQHLVSAVQGKLRRDCSPIELLKATFPGGSITGAPKVRAMEIIAELEPTARGAYCGSLGYIGFNGDMDLSILIRTITAGRGWWQMPVGGGIVAQSNADREYEETWHKATGLLQALS